MNANASAARLILLPGLGADERLFEPQRAAFPELEVPPWLPHEPEESLAGYARRMAATIRPSEHFYIGGASFGGMVALEMAQYLRPAAVFLVASCRSGQAVAPHLRYFGQFSRMLPERTFAAGRGLTPMFMKKFGALNPVQESLLGDMLADIAVAFVRWGIEAVTNWPGNVELSMPVYHIHGSDDELIPAANVRPDRLVPGGGHLLNVTHSEEVNAFMRERAGISGPQT